MRKFIFIAVIVAALVALACSNTRQPVIPGADTDSGTDTDTGTSTEAGLGPGEDCSGGGECLEGFSCSGIDGTCQPDGAPGTTPEDGDCVSSDWCQFGLLCASDGTCQQPGDPGTTEAGGQCEESEDCIFFLECLDGICQGFQPPFWMGAECAAPDAESEPLKVYFEVDGDSGEFYRLPFPNDARLSGGHIDLDGHANPGVLVPALGNPVDDYFEVVEEDMQGFGTQACVFFRFNRWPSGPSLDNMETLYILNIDPDSETYGDKAWSAFRADDDQGRYICNNWLALCPNIGRPLEANTTYAAIITTEVTDGEGNPVNRDDDFEEMLSSSSPGGGLAGAWEAYQPLRDYIDGQGYDASLLAAAAVFTTGDPEVALPNVRDAVRGEPAPVVSDLTSDVSDPDFDLYQGLYSVPFYQAGVRPFTEPADGGGIDYTGDGTPVRVEDEDVAFVLTVPKGAAPATGWPVVLYAHGTGGSEMSFVNNDTASLLAGVGAAVLGIEQVQHGDRRGLSSDEADLESNSPERLFYNFLNPRAARDNNVQAAADHFQLVRLIEDFQTITGEDVVFDVDRIYFFGHSQGTQGPFLFAAHEPLVKGLILSGAGGYLIESLLGKTNPIDITVAIKLALADYDVDRYHPLLNLIQAVFDPVDPANYGQTVFRDDMSEQGYPRRHFFMSYGIGDTYTPEETQVALAKALGGKQWPVAGHEIPSVAEVDGLPHTETVYYGNGIGVTAVVVQYMPDDDYDGHFVIFNHTDALTQSSEFVRTMIEDTIPTLVEP